MLNHWMVLDRRHSYMNAEMLTDYYFVPVYKVMRMMVKLKIHRIMEFVQDQIVEKKFVDGDKMMLIDHLVKKIMIMVMELTLLLLLLNYYYYPLIIIQLNLVMMKKRI